METILAAVISGAVTMVVCLVNNHAQAEKTRALLDYRLSELEKKVDKHNNFASRIPVLEEQMKVSNHRIADLEHIVQKEEAV